MLDEVPDGLSELMDQIATGLDLDRNTAVAFTHIAFGRHIRDLRRGSPALRSAGGPRSMDLAQEDGNAMNARMSRGASSHAVPPGRQWPAIALTFDQVEALQTAPGDRDALFAFGQMIRRCTTARPTRSWFRACNRRSRPS